MTQFGCIDTIAELHDAEVESVNGGVWGAVIALAALALAAYETGKDDGRCHV